MINLISKLQSGLNLVVADENVSEKLMYELFRDGFDVKEYDELTSYFTKELIGNTIYTISSYTYLSDQVRVIGKVYDHWEKYDWSAKVVLLIIDSVKSKEIRRKKGNQFRFSKTALEKVETVFEIDGNVLQIVKHPHDKLEIIEI